MAIQHKYSNLDLLMRYRQIADQLEKESDENKRQRLKKQLVKRRNQIAEQNIGLVKKIVKRQFDKLTPVVQAQFEFDDLVQVGTMALLTSAVSGYNSKHGCTFSTYAGWVIKGHILHHLRDRKIIRVRRVYEDHRAQIKALIAEEAPEYEMVDRLNQSTKRTWTLEEVVEAKIELSDYRFVSIDQSHDDEENNRGIQLAVPERPADQRKTLDWLITELGSEFEQEYFNASALMHLRRKSNGSASVLKPERRKRGTRPYQLRVSRFIQNPSIQKKIRESPYFKGKGCRRNVPFLRKQGRRGATYLHKSLGLDFLCWLSPVTKKQALAIASGNLLEITATEKGQTKEAALKEAYMNTLQIHSPAWSA